MQRPKPEIKSQSEMNNVDTFPEKKRENNAICAHWYNINIHESIIPRDIPVELST